MPRYGDWASQPEVAHILADFLNNLGGTSWMKINSGYYDSSGNVGTSQVSHGGTCYDPYSHGKSLSDDDVLVSLMVMCQRANTTFCTALRHVHPVPLVVLNPYVSGSGVHLSVFKLAADKVDSGRRCVGPAGDCENVHRQWATQESQWGLFCHQQR